MQNIKRLVAFQRPPANVENGHNRKETAKRTLMSSTHLNNSLVKRIRRPLGRIRRWLRSTPARTQKQRETLLLDTSLTPADRNLLKLVETRISPNDAMYIGNGAHYYRVGLSAIEC